MPVNAAIVSAELDRATAVLDSLVGEAIDALEVKSLEADDAPLLGRVVSKLSPMIGNLLEARVISVLDEHAEHGFRWQRQDPGFPDAILTDENGQSTGAGFEVKAWFVHSTELTGRFRESVNLLAPKQVRVVVVAWSMSKIVYGVPQVLGVLVANGTELARSRDQHYWSPPNYLTVEPNDTSARTANLQQSNVNGYRLQDVSLEQLREARDVTRTSVGLHAEPHTGAAQMLAVKLMNAYPYRLDTNFAKLDRIDSADIEAFKARILKVNHEGKTVASWTKLLGDLGLEAGSPREIAAAEAISALYNQL